MEPLLYVSRTVSGCIAVLPQLHSIRRSVSDSVFQSLVEHVAGHATSRLWQHNTRWASHVSAPSTSVGAQRRRQTDFTDLLGTSTSHRCWETFTGRGLRNASTSSWLYSSTDACLSDHIQLDADSHSRRIRSSSSMRLVIRCTRLFTVADHAFPVAGCRLWNSLPPDVTSAPTLTFFGIASKLISFPDHFLHHC